MSWVTCSFYHGRSYRSCCWINSHSLLIFWGSAFGWCIRIKWKIGALRIGMIRCSSSSGDLKNLFINPAARLFEIIEWIDALSSAMALTQGSPYCCNCASKTLINSNRFWGSTNGTFTSSRSETEVCSAEKYGNCLISVIIYSKLKIM